MADHPFPEMVEIWKENKENCTAAAIIQDGEVTSGMMPADDYKLHWMDADLFLAMPALKKHADAVAKSTPKSWVKQIR